MRRRVRQGFIQQQIQSAMTSDPAEAARSAGLEYVSDEEPGIQRRRCGRRGFTYLGVDGQRIKAPQEIQRIKSLAIPPAYTDVWICPLANGHLQATGRDAKGRKQYRYHPRWRSIRDQAKFTRMLAFSQALPALRQRLDHDLARPQLPKQKVLAAVVQLMELTRIRVGNEEYARSNQSYGLTTLQDDHVDISGSKVRFRFRGKSGVEHDIELRDRRLARIVKRCRDIPGQDLFQYIDDQGNYQTIESGDVNDYLRAITGEDFTAKDFRTWAGTVLAAAHLVEIGAYSSPTAGKKNITQAIKAVAEHLGNRPATCRQYYVHPAILDAYLDQSLQPIMATHLSQDSPDRYALQPQEMAVVAVLEQRLLQDLEQPPDPP